ncbi:NBAS subunit of NRZ tethering complex isoform X2 [Plutella xylostella]|uniref:NBAS subunit of NRZ tethering complex isoform X2 n=1 Tax=Plutella xylostella TaxID=51655 RepID=UPI0020329E07|nr:NBAS subunit of NRZ tethering complex isoform X2 [Plutella xylostella]
MEERKPILHELYVFSEWKPEPEYLQKPDNILPENLSALWRWLKFFGPKKSLLDSVSAFKENQQKWHIALGDEGKVIAVLTDNILEIRTKRSEYATIAARTTVNRDAYPQWRKVVWSPDCSFVAVAYGNGVVSFFDLTASNLFNIPIDCNRPGGLECTDNTHAVADIIFMPLRVKDNKWNWEVLIVTYDGALRAFLVSATEGCSLQHTFRFAGGVAAVAHSAAHDTLYVAGVPRGSCKDPSSPLYAGLTAWRILSDDPYYKLSVVSDSLEAQMASDSLHLYIPFVSSKNMAFIVQMVISPDGSHLLCVHCTGEISVWRLPLLKLQNRWPLAIQPQHDVDNPLETEEKREGMYHPADVDWWSNEDIIISRFNGAVSVCSSSDLAPLLQAQWLRGAARVASHSGAALVALECERSTHQPRAPRSQSTELVKQDADSEDTMYELTKEMVKSILYAITDIETFQPKPKKITVVSRIYRLLGIKSTTPEELFARKIESGNYEEALALADSFHLDSDLVYQQQWRKNPVSTDAIQKYLSKVSKKIWAVHQCVDRLPETLPAARELLQFGLELTNQEILHEINKDRSTDNRVRDPEKITLEDLNAYSSELLRCRHVMLFYKERLKLYEAILRCEKSTYVKDEYDRLRSNSIVYSATELAKEGRLSALTCLWPHIKTAMLRLAVLETIPETINPLEYKDLLATLSEEDITPVREKIEKDWCRKETFRSIWSSNWSEDPQPAGHAADLLMPAGDVIVWYMKRARQIEENSGIVSHAATLVRIASHSLGLPGLEHLLHEFQTLDTLVYDIDLPDVTLKQVQTSSPLEICQLLMKKKTPATFVSDLKSYVVPYLKRHEELTGRACVLGLADYLESVSEHDLSWILLVLQSPTEFQLDVRTHLDIAERCMMAHKRSDQLDKLCDLLATILKETDGSISPVELLRRLNEMERLLSICRVVWWRGVDLPAGDLRNQQFNPEKCKLTLTRMARSLAVGDNKPTQQDWEKLLKDILDIQANCNVSKKVCYEIYGLALLTSGDAASIKLAANVLTCDANVLRRGNNRHKVKYETTVELIIKAAREYFNSASSLTDPALDLAKCCLMLIQDGNPQIQEELDLIDSLQILSSFNVPILPIQVRLCEDKMQLVEQCLSTDPNAYLASHKLLKLAKLLRIAGDDDQKREGEVLMVVCMAAMAEGAAGAAAGGEAARRLAALRYPPAAAVLPAQAVHSQGTLDRNTRRDLFAAAVTFCDPKQIEDILRARISLELEALQEIGAAVKEQARLNDQWPSTDEEFADAITTPVIERKDLVTPSGDKKLPILDYLVDTWQSKFNTGDKSGPSEPTSKRVHCLKLYHTLYPQYDISPVNYRYSCFAVPDRTPAVASSLLQVSTIHSCLGDAEPHDPVMESQVFQKCAEETLYSDTAYSVACLLRSTQDGELTRRTLETQNTDTAICAALYATLIKCNTPELRDNVYLTKPINMARNTVIHNNASTDQLKLIRACLDKLMVMVEVDRVKKFGYTINAAMFTADEDYRKQIVYRMARSANAEHIEFAFSLSQKYEIESIELWLQHAGTVIRDHSAIQQIVDLMPSNIDKQTAVERLETEIWDDLPGDEHNVLINYFTLLKSIDERAAVCGFTPAEHVKLLKKAKAASPELNYKLLLEQPSPEEFSAHILQIIKPENVGLLTKLLRTLPPAFKIPVPVNVLYTMWLTKYFFSVSPTSATNKKWMQQYRQCASYFNKLSKEDLLTFVSNTCFSDEACERVPAGTRNLMIMQAVDYCQQEQENDNIKINKNESSWAQVGQELTRWARFLDNFHSDTIQAIIASNAPGHEVWTAIEKSHGSVPKARRPLCRLMMETTTRPGAFCTLIQCLHLDIQPDDVFTYAVEEYVDDLPAVQTLVSRVTNYFKEGVKLSEELLDKVMHTASVYGLPPHKQIGLLSLTQKNQIQDGDDMMKIVEFTLDLFKTEWADAGFAKDLTDEDLLSDEGRREAFMKFLELSDSWQRKKALVDVLNCWPPTRNGGQSRSLHCDYIQTLLKNEDQKESLVLIKLLLRKPVLVEEELQWLSNNVQGDAVINLIWVIILSKCEHSLELIPTLAKQHKTALLNAEIEDDLVKDLLDSGLFIKLVSTPFYSSITNFILNRESSNGEPVNQYDVKWATTELLKANFVAEAGHLKLLAIGVPAPLRGFSQSVMYYKNFFN